MSRLPSKIAVVTRAARGIGLACARAFASEDALVIATDIEVVGVEAATSAIGRNAIGRKLDVRDEGDWERVLAEAFALHGRSRAAFRQGNVGCLGLVQALGPRSLFGFGSIPNVLGKIPPRRLVGVSQAAATDICWPRYKTRTPVPPSLNRPFATLWEHTMDASIDPGVRPFAHTAEAPAPSVPWLNAAALGAAMSIALGGLGFVVPLAAAACKGVMEGMELPLGVPTRAVIWVGGWWIVAAVIVAGGLLAKERLLSQRWKVMVNAAALLLVIAVTALALLVVIMPLISVGNSLAPSL